MCRGRHSLVSHSSGKVSLGTPEKGLILKEYLCEIDPRGIIPHGVTK